ncbi:hypothetical protein Plo01_64730 [Planobispora longispora]|uniref:Uncharacterized protein n=1 Tax=Planobispora longispora TaxID=28887 RepID=A0A8J3W7X4_9ACTN|nr:hypothetical protein Plo01_64730 [Planobispora longispora]
MAQQVGVKHGGSVLDVSIGAFQILRAGHRHHRLSCDVEGTHPSQVTQETVREAFHMVARDAGGCACLRR